MTDWDKPLARCMGGKFCKHQPGECTADPEYQAYMKRKAMTDDPITKALSRMMASMANYTPTADCRVRLVPVKAKLWRDAGLPESGVIDIPMGFSHWHDTIADSDGDDGA